MKISNSELFSVLRQYNPWWGGNRMPDLPDWRRAAFREIAAWAQEPPAGRALLLSGARQVGKTTLFLQVIDELLSQGVPAALKGMREFCAAHRVERGYVITREWRDFGVLDLPGAKSQTRLLKVPAPLACYWLGQSELEMVKGE